MINPKSLDISHLPCLALSEKFKLPSIAGVYLCVDRNNTVQYIGQSRNIYQRWLQHHRANQLSEIGNIKIYYLAVSDVLLLNEIEKALINWYEPCLNFTRISIETNEDKVIKRSISLPKNLADKIQEYSSKQKRSFSSQIALWAEEKLNEINNYDKKSDS